MILLAPNSPLVCKEVTRCCREEQHLQQWLSCSSYSSRRRPPLGYFRFRSSGDRPSQVKRGSGLLGAFWPDSTRPVAEMESIEDCDQLDRVLLQAQELSQPILIDWMATWCRKCIYLKPKLEKLAAEYDSKIKFYFVDVNKVPQTLVKRGNISKMPTIQVWKDGEMKAEVIGGHKAWLVIEEVREMIQKFV